LSRQNEKCPKCAGAMTEGHIPDFCYGAILRSSWIVGVPEKNWLGSIKTKGKTLLPITSCRCSSCGYLEQYAKTEP
jgi:hypothetical protein